MPNRTERTVSLLRAVVYQIQADNLTFMASSLAYHAFVSLLPLLLLFIAVISTMGDSTLERGLFEFTSAILSTGANDMLVAELRRASASAGVSLISVGFLIWGMFRIFWGLDTAFSVIYNSESENTFVDHVVDGAIVLVTVAIAVLAAVTIEAKMTSLTGGFPGWIFQRVLLFVGLSLTFLPMFYVFPDQRNLSLLEILPGVLIATVGLTVLESLFDLYLTIGSQSPDQNVILAVLVLLTWLYFSSLVILIGAVVNVVTSNRSRKVNVRPVVGGPSFEESETPPVRTELVSTLERLDTGLGGGNNLVVRGDDGDASLPTPDVVIVDSGKSDTLLESGPVGLELYWFPRESE